MNYGEIIKKSWKLTWRYKALWVLGLFAGVTGGSASGGSNGGGSSSSNFTDSMSSGDLPSELNPQHWLPALERLLPVIIVTIGGLMIIGFAWWILSIAARGGLIWGVNEIEAGRPFTLGAGWNAGFNRFWRLLGLSVLLTLPVFVLALAVLAGAFLPIVLPFLRGGEPSAGAIVPLCGTLAIGLPLLIVAGLVLGVMNILGTRFVMLGDSGVFEAAGQGWKSVRHRFKDTALMYLVNLGLNLLAGFVLVIPMIAIVALAVTPAVISGIAGQWAGVAVAAALGVLALMAISFAYTAVWGTFTSALWTIFFRRMTGMEVPVPVEQAPAPAVPPQPDYAPPPPPPVPAGEAPTGPADV